ncbi:sugar phosphate isomerase/epimerase family protein [Evansella cellulosilytica]|uniref:Xylose isomerase domain-containing protein TIM barrel n=1 Tax=Evansella cellulosilytica (strain ATCC 21833 / DSM 2522 / FERM P-1141 / JCM 9156 / N-4) TaxID=649639 RepID=E6TQL5_EVAC2|nr:sugar phosphate isomerase/epimerase [Evansella cellulosilytica]ADU30526.1 Xylose isomerase domain-containing protein TIM barrel [Evansella cellulosilytica DSM 2522]
MRTIPVALQMFTLREEAQKDFAGTLKRVAELGFDGVEFAGFGDLTAQEVKSLLDELGLKAASSHVSLEELQNNLDKVIEDQKIIGSKYVVCPFLLPDERTEEHYKALISFLDKAGEVCRREGITLCYHNHAFELERLSDGRTALESIFDDTNPDNVSTEFDIYWLTKAGETPLDWIKKYEGRTPLVHIKDMTTDGEQFFAELGTGGVDLDTVLDNGVEAGVQWWIVEQDQTRKTPFESIEISMNYLKNKLPQYS